MCFQEQMFLLETIGFTDPVFFFTTLAYVVSEDTEEFAKDYIKRWKLVQKEKQTS